MKNRWLLILRYIAHSKLAIAVTLIGLLLLFTYQLSVRNAVTIAPGAEPGYGFYVAVTPGVHIPTHGDRSITFMPIT